MASAESLVIPLGLPDNINDWDEDQATTFLTANQHVYRLKDDEIKAIKEQGLDGGDLLDLEVEHLQRCGIRAGPAMRIVRHISKLKVEGSLSLVTSEQKLTEKRFLSRVPPAINYIENGKSKGTTKPARGLIPQSVDHWPTFKNKAGGLGFDDSIQLYNKPVFSEALVASKEAEVDSAFNINILVNLKTIIGQGLRFHGQEPMPGGTPDHLITTEDDDNDILLFIEIKSKWVIDCDDIVQKYHNDLHITREGKSPYMSIIDPIKQVFGYMGHGKLQYGVMSTYDRTWFLRRPKDNPGCLQISECVKYTDTDPTLLQCLAYMITLPRNGNNYSPTPPPSSPPPPPPQNDSESSEGDDHVLDSSYRPRSSGRGGNRGQGGNRSQGEKRRGFDAKGEGSGSTTNQVHMPEQFDWDDFDTTNVLGHGRCGMVFEATFRGEKVALKLGDIWQHPELEEEMLTEMKTYMALEQLQGHTIPKFKGAGYTAGGLFAIATEMMGSPIKVEDLSYSERCKIVDALSKIHRHGFIHNDIRPENILIQRHRDGFKVTFIDFAFSKRASKKEEPRKEMATLKTMLGLRKFKKPRPA